MEICGIDIISQTTVIGETLFAHHRPGTDLAPCGGGRQKDRPGLLRVNNDVFQHFRTEIGIRTMCENNDPGISRGNSLINQAFRHEHTVMFSKWMSRNIKRIHFPGKIHVAASIECDGVVHAYNMKNIMAHLLWKIAVWIDKCFRLKFEAFEYRLRFDHLLIYCPNICCITRFPYLGTVRKRM